MKDVEAWISKSKTRFSSKHCKNSKRNTMWGGFYLCSAPIRTGFYDTLFQYKIIGLQRGRIGGFHDFTNVILSIHESRMYRNSRIHEQIFRFSRIHERYFFFSRITNDILFTNSRTIFFIFTNSRTKKRQFPLARTPLGGPPWVAHFSKK